MASAGGRRGDTRREPELAEAYDIEKSMLNGRFAVALRERSSVQFFKSFRVKLLKKLTKLEVIGTRLLKLCEDRRSDFTLIQRDLDMLRERGEAKKNEVDSLLMELGVCVDDLEWNGGESGSSRNSSGLSWSGCFDVGDAHHVSRIADNGLVRERQYPGSGNLQLPVLHRAVNPGILLSQQPF